MPHACEHDADHRALLRSAGLRITPARMLILDILCHSAQALDVQQVADQLAERLPPTRGKPAKSASAADRVTIYRTLNSLVESGIAHRVDPGDRIFRFGLAGEHEAHVPATSGEKPGALGPLHTHPHFVCNQCGSVECLDDTDVILKPADAKRPPRPRRITQQEVLLRGLCDRCLSPMPAKR